MLAVAFLPVAKINHVAVQSHKAERYLNAHLPPQAMATDDDFRNPLRTTITALVPREKETGRIQCPPRANHTNLTIRRRVLQVKLTIGLPVAGCCSWAAS